MCLYTGHIDRSLNQLKQMIHENLATATQEVNDVYETLETVEKQFTKVYQDVFSKNVLKIQTELEAYRRRYKRIESVVKTPEEEAAVEAEAKQKVGKLKT